MLNRDKFQGGVRNLRGRGKTALGAVAGRPRQQVEGAFDQAAGAVQYAYGEARARARDLQQDGTRLAEEAGERGRALAGGVQDRGRAVQERGRALAGDVQQRGRHYRDEAVRHGRAAASRAEDNKTATLALVAAAAFGFGLLMRRPR